MNMEFQIPMVSLIFMIIITIIYKSKNKLSLVENKFFNMILVATFIEVVINTGLHITCSIFGYEYLTTKYFVIFEWLNRILGSLFVFIFLSLLAYILTISYKKIYKNYKKILLSIYSLSFLFLLISMFTTIEVIRFDYVYNVRGPTIDLTFFVVAVLLAITFIFALKHLKQNDKRYHAIFFITTLMIVIYLLVVFIPGIILYDLALVLLCYIMYFSIENPDAKLIKQLDLAVTEANKANQAKSDFLSSMSHEIRTPLNAIAGLTQDMIDGGKLPKELAEDAHDIVGASNTLVEIVGNIIDVSKIESQKMDVINTVYNIKEITDNVLAINKVRIGEKDIKLSVKYAQDLPHELYGDKNHMKQIINNLVSNAVKYTEKGFVKVNIKCINKKNDSIIMISVEDTGRGIKKEDINKLFTKFERLGVEKNTTTEGTGLGLAITQKLVELLGGKINVQSSFGYGSLFVAQIPQKISKMSSESVTEIKEELNKVSLKGKKVLVVDDNILNLKVARRALEPLEINLEEVTSGKDAIEKVKENKYDCILMDIMMPELSGEKTLVELQKIKGFNIPVIALTADALSGAKQKYIKLGFSDYVAKPFNKEQIKKVLEDILK